MNSVILGTRIRQARERLALSQEKLAEAVSKDQRAISEYENGQRKLAAIDLPVFAQALKVPILYFYEGEIGLDDLDYQILNEFQRLPNIEAKHSLIQIVRIFSDTLNL